MITENVPKVQPGLFAGEGWQQTHVGVTRNDGLPVPIRAADGAAHTFRLAMQLLRPPLCVCVCPALLLCSPLVLLRL